METIDKELLYREYSTLREELHSIKKAQLWFINISIATTGILLGIGGKGYSPIFFPIASLFPLTILLPSWHLFFDKAITVTRIIGYLKVLEKIIINPELAKNFTGWENALVIFRGRQQQKIQQQKEVQAKFPSEMRQLSHSARTSIRYWRICYVIFFSLSLICITLSIFSLCFGPHPEGSDKVWWFMISSATLLMVAIFFVTYCHHRNRKFLCYLAWGRYSYRVNELLWKQIILKEMILEPERLIEYGNDGFVAKSDFSQLSRNAFFINGLFRDLTRKGYIREDGAIQEKFWNLDNHSKIELDHAYKSKTEEIYNLLHQCPWRTKALNFEGRDLDFSDYTTLSITMKKDEDTQAKVKIQLIHGLDSDMVNSSVGLAPGTYELKNSFDEIKVSLKDFKDAGADLKRVYRLVIHYGHKAFGKKLSDKDNVKISIKKIVLE